MSAKHGRAAELSLDLPAAHREVRVARSMLIRFARMQHMASDEADVVALVASELLANTIDHGGGGAAMTTDELADDVRMNATLVVNPGGWTLSVTDEGGGDAEAMNRLLESASAFDLEDDRGRGLFLLKTSVDRLEVQANHKGTGLTVRAVRIYGAQA